MKKPLLGALLCALLWVAAPARADSPLRQAPLGFCSLSSMSSATLLTACVINGVTGVPAGANYALLCAYTQGVVWRDDPAGTVPTGTPGVGGQGIAAGQCFGYSGPLSRIQIIQQASGAVLGASFYK